MYIVPSDKFPRRDMDGLRGFLAFCQQQGRKMGCPVYASISLKVSHLDPLAVLQSIVEPTQAHFLAERPQEEFALAGAEAVASIEATGPERFAQVRQRAEGILERTFAVGDLDAPLAGPHFLSGFTFDDDAGSSPEHSPAYAFLPQWQVACWQGQYTAVANTAVPMEGSIEPLAQRIWAAHAKFSQFDYTAPAPTQAPPLLRQQEVPPGREGFAEGIRQALQLIAQGSFEKVVLARAQELHFDGPVTPWVWLSRLRERFPSCWSLSFSTGHPPGQSFVAATPERLLQVRGGQLRTEAIAGTCPRGATLAEDARLGAELLASDKNLREHQAVIDSIRQRLGSLGLTVAPSTPPRLLKLGNVQHLRTPLQAPLPNDLHLLDAARVLHPTPAVGGRPRSAALEHLPRLEGLCRGLYAGALGWFDAHGNGEMLVGLRSARIEGSTARLFAGAGIVAGSTPEGELAETDAKMQALRALADN